ncbi:hypothetical protein QJQ45_027040, partial [Haematococcus lacustris]
MLWLRVYCCASHRLYLVLLLHRLMPPFRDGASIEVEIDCGLLHGANSALSLAALGTLMEHLSTAAAALPKQQLNVCITGASEVCSQAVRSAQALLQAQQLQLANLTVSAGEGGAAGAEPGLQLRWEDGQVRKAEGGQQQRLKLTGPAALTSLATALS